MISMAFLEPAAYGRFTAIGLAIGVVATTLGIRALRSGVQMSPDGVLCRRMLITKRLSLEEVAGFEAADFVMPPMWIPSPLRRDYGMLIVLKAGPPVECPYIYGSLAEVRRLSAELRADLRRFRKSRQ